MNMFHTVIIKILDKILLHNLGISFSDGSENLNKNLMRITCLSQDLIKDTNDNFLFPYSSAWDRY